MGGPELRTERLVLRRWQPEDRESYAAMNSDPRVMRYFPSIWSRERSDESIASAEAHFERHGFGKWAVEIPGITRFAGFVGFAVPDFDAHFTPCVEIGWRLAVPYWNQGYATEGARAALGFGFEKAGLSEIVAFTVPSHLASRRVMDKLGMSRDSADDFDHPRVPEGHPLRRHVLYRATHKSAPCGRG